MGITRCINHLTLGGPHPSEAKGCKDGRKPGLQGGPSLPKAMVPGGRAWGRVLSFGFQSPSAIKSVYATKAGCALTCSGVTHLPVWLLQATSKRFSLSCHHLGAPHSPGAPRACGSPLKLGEHKRSWQEVRSLFPGGEAGTPGGGGPAHGVVRRAAALSCSGGLGASTAAARPQPGRLLLRPP